MSNKQEVIQFITEIEDLMKENGIAEANEETIEVMYHYTNHVIYEILQYCQLLISNSKVIRQDDIDMAIQLFLAH